MPDSTCHHCIRTEVSVSTVVVSCPGLNSGLVALAYSMVHNARDYRLTTYSCLFHRSSRISTPIATRRERHDLYEHAHDMSPRSYRRSVVTPLVLRSSYWNLRGLIKDLFICLCIGVRLFYCLINVGNPRVRPGSVCGFSVRILYCRRGAHASIFQIPRVCSYPVNQ